MAGIWRAFLHTAERLSAARPGYVAAALALYIASLVIVGARWRGFLRALGGEVSVAGATLATLGGISAGNLASPTRLGGEACRIALVRLAGRVTWRQAAIATFWDRFSEVPPLAVLAVMSLLALPRLSFVGRPASIVAGVTGAVIVSAVLVRSLRRRTWWSRWRARLEDGTVNVPVFAIGVAYSALLWLQDVLRLSCVTLALGVTLSPAKIATLSIVAMVGGLLPSLGGLGPVEGGLVAGLVAFGVDLPNATAITAIERAISYGFSTLAGALVIGLLGGRSLWSAFRDDEGSVAELQP